MSEHCNLFLLTVRFGCLPRRKCKKQHNQVKYDEKPSEFVEVGEEKQSETGVYPEDQFIYVTQGDWQELLGFMSQQSSNKKKWTHPKGGESLKMYVSFLTTPRFLRRKKPAICRQSHDLKSESCLMFLQTPCFLWGEIQTFFYDMCGSLTGWPQPISHIPFLPPCLSICLHPSHPPVCTVLGGAFPHILLWRMFIPNQNSLHASLTRQNSSLLSLWKDIHALGRRALPPLSEWGLTAAQEELQEMRPCGHGEHQKCPHVFLKNELPAAMRLNPLQGYSRTHSPPCLSLHDHLPTPFLCQRSELSDGREQRAWCHLLCGSRYKVSNRKAAGPLFLCCLFFSVFVLFGLSCLGSWRDGVTLNSFSM